MSAQVYARGLSVSHYVRKSWFRGNPGNLCLWNPESWALKSGIQLKESGILESRIQNCLWFTSHGRFVLSTLKLSYMGKQVKRGHWFIICDFGTLWYFADHFVHHGWGNFGSHVPVWSNIWRKWRRRRWTATQLLLWTTINCRSSWRRREYTTVIAYRYFW